MVASTPFPQGSQPTRFHDAPAMQLQGPVLEDLELGCECANPALQIQWWMEEAAALEGAT